MDDLSCVPIALMSVISNCVYRSEKHFSQRTNFFTKRFTFHVRSEVSNIFDRNKKISEKHFLIFLFPLHLSLNKKGEREDLSSQCRK